VKLKGFKKVSNDKIFEKVCRARFSVSGKICQDVKSNTPSMKEDEDCMLKTADNLNWCKSTRQ
jgi:hypothetical protein